SWWAAVAPTRTTRPSARSATCVPRRSCRPPWTACWKGSARTRWGSRRTCSTSRARRRDGRRRSSDAERSAPDGRGLEHEIGERWKRCGRSLQSRSWLARGADETIRLDGLAIRVDDPVVRHAVPGRELPLDAAVGGGGRQREDLDG